MTEQAPSGQSALDKERARLASERAKLDRKEGILKEEELFGKYDEGVTPVEGEMTYQQYLEQRPAEGVVRNGKVFQDAQSGKFAAEESYEAQKGDTQAHYDQVGNLVNNGEYQPPNYETMGVVQLAKEASKARALGDRAAEQEIHAAAEHHVTMSALHKKDDGETPKEAQARYDADLARYYSLIERFENLQSTVKTEKAAPEPVVVEDAPVEEDSPEEDSEPEADAPTSETDIVTLEAHYNGEKVTIDNVFESPDGKKVVQVVDAEGKSHLIFEQELTYEAPVEDEPKEDSTDVPEPKTPAFFVDSAGEVSPAGTENDDPAKGKELVPFVGSQGRELVPVAVEQDEAEKLSRLDRIKNWFKKERSYYQEFGGHGYMGRLWEQAQRGINNVLNVGVTEEMSKEEKEHKRNRNRVVILVGVGALAATGLGLAFIHGASSGQGAHRVAGGQGAPPSLKDILNHPGGGGTGGSHGAENLPFNGGTGVPGVETVAAGPEISSIPAEAFNIPRGLGGEQLFTNLGIDPSKWYNNESSLLSQFPTDFYRMSDGHVGIAHSGMLSQGAQDFIESLK